MYRGFIFLNYDLMNAKNTPEAVTIDNDFLSLIGNFIVPNPTGKAQTHEIEFYNYGDLIYSVSGMIKTSINALRLSTEITEKLEKDNISLEVANTLEIANKLLPYDVIDFIDKLTNR